MESGASNSCTTKGGKYPGIKDGSWFTQFRYGSNPWMARYVYGFIFLITNFLAWVVRDYGQGAIKLLGMKQPGRFKECHGGRDCSGTIGVLRVSLGCFMFFMAMFISTVGTSKVYDRRDTWHSGWWFAKASMFVGFMLLSFLFPPSFVYFYGEIAHFGAGYTSCVADIQLVSVITFITWLNDCFQTDKTAETWYTIIPLLEYKTDLETPTISLSHWDLGWFLDRRVYVTIVASASYFICIVGVILMYLWYAPDTTCILNIFFITWTIVLLQLMTSVALQPKINKGFLTPGIMGLYIVFLCWCAIRSEPPGTSCNRKAEASKRTDWLTLISFIVALLTIVFATFSTGIDSKCFQFLKKETEEEEDVPYGYGFFHLVFATGAMYFAMLLVGWNSHHHMQKWTIDVGWTSTWVRIVNEWLAACVYIWMLVAPVILKNRQVSEIP